MAGYGTDEEFASYLLGLGLVLPDDAPSPAALRQRGSDYLDATYEPQLQCSRRTSGFEQERAWPRTGHRVGGETLPSDLIPRAWVLASYRAAWLEATNPGWASGVIDPNRKTKREKVDVLEREFFGPKETGGEGAAGPLGNVDAVIAGMVTPLLCSGRGIGFVVI